MPQLDWLDQTVTALSPGFPDRLAIVDLETTGGSPVCHRVIEVGVLLVDNGQLVSRWQRLIQPNVAIPAKIHELTGISDADVKTAPAFAEVADELLTVLRDRVIVAHNVGFDYGFLKAEFKRIGMVFKSKRLCSVKLSRHFFPQFRRHSLNHIIRRFGYRVINRHRAIDDAEVIWRFCLNISEIYSEDDIFSACELIFKAPSLPAMLNADMIKALPRSPGVYYFYDSTGKLLYIGKSVNIRDRVKSHFSREFQRGRQFRLYSSVARIEYELTPSDFGAQIRESQQIKQLHPDFNLRLKKSRYLYFYTLSENSDGYLEVDIERINASIPDSRHHFGLFRSRQQAQTQLAKLADPFFLCYKLTGLEKSTRAKQACFRTQLKKCFGACCGREPAHVYNDRLLAALKRYRIMQWPWQDAILIRETSPADGDFSHYHLVDQWRYLGRVTDEQALLDKGYCHVGRSIMSFQDRPAIIQNSIGTHAENGEVLSDPCCEKAPVPGDPHFDLDIYFILVRFLLNPASGKQQGVGVVPLIKTDETESFMTL